MKVFKEIENENNKDKRNELQNKANEIVNLVFCATNPVPLAYFLKTQVLLPLCIEDISSENKEKIDKVIEENKEMLFTKTS